MELHVIGVIKVNVMIKNITTFLAILLILLSSIFYDNRIRNIRKNKISNLCLPSIDDETFAKKFIEHNQIFSKREAEIIAIRQLIADTLEFPKDKIDLNMHLYKDIECNGYSDRCIKSSLFLYFFGIGDGFDDLLLELVSKIKKVRKVQGEKITEKDYQEIENITTVAQFIFQYLKLQT